MNWNQKNLGPSPQNTEEKRRPWSISEEIFSPFSDNSMSLVIDKIMMLFLLFTENN